MEFLDPRGNHVLLFFLSLLSCSSFFSSLFLLARLHLSIFLVIYCFIQRSVDVTLAAFANHYSFYYLFFFILLAASETVLFPQNTSVTAEQAGLHHHH